VLLVAAIIAAIFWLPTGWGIVTVLAAGVVELAEVGLWVWYSKRRRPTTGIEALVGAVGVAVTRCEPDGRVRVDGELWSAVCADGAQPGDRVVVDRVDEGLTLAVTPLHSARG
jgi:membrane protein implicated in regulation of membrane protease activity